MSKIDHFCPNCGSILENQEGFSHRKKGWVCKDCGQALYGKDDKKRKYQGIVWTCDVCGEILDNQRGFSDKHGIWKCKSCGYDNIIDESNIISSEETPTPEIEMMRFIVEDGIKRIISKAVTYNNDDEYDEEDESYDYNDDIDDDPTSYEEYEKIYEEKRKKKEILEKIRLEEEKIDKEKRKAWSRKNRKKILIGLVSFLIIVFILTILIVSKNLIQVGYSPDKLIGLKYDLVEEKLYSKGFTNIEIRKITDLTLKERKKSEIVTEVIIGNKNNFSSKSKFFSNEKIIIVYHTTKKIFPPITSKAAKGKDYKDIVTEFKNKGFVNIKTKKIKDLVTGWITKDGEVDSITINSKNDYTTLDEFEEDAEVIINYHTFKQKKIKKKS